MDSISSGWDSTRREETPYFHCGPSKSERKWEKNVNEEKNMRMDKSKEKTIIHIPMYTHTPTNTQTYIITDAHIHIYIVFITQVT